jgi:hypothetical protein
MMKTMKAQLLLVTIVLMTFSTMYGKEVPQWGIYEVSMKVTNTNNPFKDVKLSAIFQNKNRTILQEGFYNGNSEYIIRFMPDSVGEWSYITKSNIDSLNAKTGKFECVSAQKGNHGPVYVRNIYDFGYADGTPFYPAGTTCYAWVWQGDEMVNRTLKTLKKTAFNKIRMCLFPKQFDVYIQNEPFCYPFEGSKEKGWDFSRFNPKYFQYFEDKIARLGELGIEADVIIFHPYDGGKWGFDNMPREVNERYMHYLVARLSAYHNVWWSMANEWDLVQSKTPEDWERLFKIIEKNDPYHHLRSIHNGMKWYDVSKSYITHLSVQSTDFFHIQEWRETYNKPVMIDECVYEGNIPNDWGNLTPEEMTSRFWQVYCRGGYCTHGETYLHPQNILWWSKGGILYGKSPERIAFLHKIMNDRPFDSVYPIHNLWNKEMQLIKDKEYYLIYYGNTQQKSARLRLPTDIKFELELIDTWNMTIKKIDGVYSDTVEIKLPGTLWMAVRARKITNKIEAKVNLKKYGYTPDQNIFDIIRQVKPYQLMGSKILFANTGINSFSYQEGALIVIDGVKMGTDSGILNSVPVTDIEKINVYTDPSDVLRFTGLNSSGIIEIISKKGH